MNAKHALPAWVVEQVERAPVPGTDGLVVGDFVRDPDLIIRTAFAEFLAIIEERAGKGWKIASFTWVDSCVRLPVYKPLADLLEARDE